MNRTLIFFLITYIGLTPVFFSCINKNTKKKLFYKGVNLKYPHSWDLDVNELPEESYFIKAKDEGNTLFISFTDKKIELKSLIEDYLNDVDSAKYKVSKGKIAPAKFGNYNTLSSKFTIANSTDNMYGTIYAFEHNKRIFLIVTQSDTKEGLEKNFETIKESFDVGTKL